jgi:hypothetical protein
MSEYKHGTQFQQTKLLLPTILTGWQYPAHWTETYTIIYFRNPVTIQVICVGTNKLCNVMYNLCNVNVVKDILTNRHGFNVIL